MAFDRITRPCRQAVCAVHTQRLLLRWAVVPALLVVLACPLAAAESILPDDLPVGFDDLASEAAEVCGEGRRPDLPMSGFTRPYDFNGDGVDDYLVDSSDFRCAPDFALIWGGTAGNAYLVYLSRPDGSFEQAYAASGNGMRLVDMWEDGRAMVLVIFRHGTYCGLAGVSSCVSAVIWDPVSQDFTGMGYEPMP